MADMSVENSSTSESSNEPPGNNEKNTVVENKPEEGNKVQNMSENKVGSAVSKPSNNIDAESGVGTAATTTFSASFLKNEGNARLNHRSSPLRPSVFGSPSASTSASSSLFGSSICSPMLSSSPNSFPRNLFAKSSLSCSRPVENRSPVFQKPVLRPSQLASPNVSDSSSTPTKSPNPFVLNPPKLANPFVKVNVACSESIKPSSEGDNVDTKDANPTISISKIQDNNIATSTAAGQPGLPTQQQSCNKTATTSLSFVPLTTLPGSATSNSPLKLPSSSSAPTVSSSTTPGGFVFGQNLHERVIVEPTGSSSEASTSNSLSSDTVTTPSALSSAPSVHNDVSSTSAATAATNGTSSEMLFTSVIKKELPEKTLDGGGSTDDKGKKSLTESAREYEESRAVKRKYEEVAVVTGEEEENNILQMDCKLFVYDGSKFNYSEGVHGSLRVNDPPVTAKKVTQSRVIVRMSGTLRVLMNTKIWAGMKIEKPNRKIVRMTAMDSIGQIKVFLISSSPSESDMLYRVLESRIKLQKELTGACQNGSVEDSEKNTSSQ